MVNAAGVPIANKQLYQKTDKVDCKNLCKHLRDDRLSDIHIPTESQEQLKRLLRHRNNMVKRLRKEKQMIKVCCCS